MICKVYVVIHQIYQYILNIIIYQRINHYSLHLQMMTSVNWEPITVMKTQHVKMNLEHSPAHVMLASLEMERHVQVMTHCILIINITSYKLPNIYFAYELFTNFVLFYHIHVFFFIFRYK